MSEAPPPIDEPAGPVVRRRRRRIVRHVREKTPEPSAKGGPTLRRHSDEDDDTVDGDGGLRAAPSSSADGNHVGEMSSAVKHSGSSHRSKILSLRDRGVGPSISFRSQSSPRVADETINANAASNVGLGSLLRQVKRSMSSPRQPLELALHHTERDSRVPVREIPDTSSARSSTPVNRSPIESHKTHESGRELTKLERNLRRFEEERLRFEQEKRRFEQEKLEAETIARNRRLQAFERKRAERQQAEVDVQDVHQKLYSILRVIEDNKHHLPGILKAEASGDVWKTSSEEDKPRSPNVMIKKPIAPLKLDVLDYPNESSVSVGDDYESSTAKSSSSREGDFDDEECITVVEGESSGKIVTSKSSIPPTIDGTTNPEPVEKRSIFQKLFGRKTSTPAPQRPQHQKPSDVPVSLRRFIFVETRLVWHQLLTDHQADWETARRCRNRCIADLVILLILCGVGGLTFRFVEGSFENFYKCGVRRVKRDFVDHLWATSHNLREDDWKEQARSKLRAFEEELHAAHEAGMTSYSGMKAWTFVNGLIYCLTVVTTIGYGHIYPSTNTGRAITIVYSLVGIPLFMILLNDFGKYFTWRIKFGVAFVRRLSNTSSLARIFKQYYVQRTIRIINKLYSFILVKRNCVVIRNDPDFQGSTLDLSAQPALTEPKVLSDPTAATTVIIDDEFDLPIYLALAILFGYISCGAVVFAFLEDWTIFEAGYFAFVSMSTIGFGDYVPQSSVNMLGSILYLIFGLALTAMCLTVLQNRYTNGFGKVRSRIGATLGMLVDADPVGNVTNESVANDNVNQQRVRRVKRRSANKMK